MWTLDEYYNKDCAGRIKPDIIIKKDKKIHHVLDTKYRDIEELLSPKSKDGKTWKYRNLSVLYQLGVYAQTCSSKGESRMVYPVERSKCDSKIIRMVGAGLEKDLCTIVLCPVNLVEMAALINSPNEEGRKDYAHKLIGEGLNKS